MADRDEDLAMDLLQTLNLTTWNEETQTDDVDSSQVTDVLAAFDAVRARAAEQAKPEVQTRAHTGGTTHHECTACEYGEEIHPGDADWVQSAKPEPVFDKPPVSFRDIDEIARYVGIAAERVRALFGVLAMVSPPEAKPAPQQPSTREMTSVDLLSKVARIEAVIAAADNWRETLSLPQQELGCAEFNEAWEAYDVARAEVDDLIGERSECPECDCHVSELTGAEGPDGKLWHRHCLNEKRIGGE